MAANRKTRTEHEASGAMKKNPKRFEADPHTPPTPKQPIKKAPRHLDAAQQKVWREIVSSAPEGILGTCDAIIVEVAVGLIQKMRLTPTLWKSSDAATLAGIMGKLGGTPGDRQRLNVTSSPEKSEEASVFDELDA